MVGSGLVLTPRSIYCAEMVHMHNVSAAVLRAGIELKYSPVGAVQTRSRRASRERRGEGQTDGP